MTTLYRLYAMHPRIQEVFSALDGSRESLRSTIANIPGDTLGMRPSNDRWSVAEVVEHLGIVETRISQMVREKLAAARQEGLAAETETAPVAPMLDIARVTDRSKPITASEASQPRGGLSVEDGLKVLTERRAQLHEAITAADGLALGTVEIPHPRLGTLNVYQWLLFLAGHEARHTAQIREVASAITSANA